jgi:hypothetical protein
MKRQLYTYCALVACTVFIFGNCKKSSDDTPVTPVVNFSPYTANSTWTYRTELNTTFTLTATNRDTSINARTYRVLTNSTGGNNYLAKVDHDYYRYGIIPAVGATGLEELYLKDNVDVNGTWTDSKSINVTGIGAVPVNLLYTVKSKGGTRTVNGVVFNKVTYVRLDISSIVGAVGGGDFYYAEGVGVIEQVIVINPIPLAGITGSTSSQVLINYVIR